MCADRLHFAVATVLTLLSVPSIEAQSTSPDSAAAGAESTAERCAGAVYREFDFWLGDWEVRNADGGLLGTNRVSREATGCALLENWSGRGGSRGISVNAYDSATAKWTQRWVGDDASLWLEGEREEVGMVLTGRTTRDTPQGKVLDRITWSPLPDGRVLQVWEVSPDEGRTWNKVFEGFYSRRAGRDPT